MLARKTITIDSSKIYYWERNPHLVQTLVFIHGLKGNHKALTELSAYFDEHRTILIDLPGYGESEPFHNKTHSVSNYAQFLNTFLRELNLNRVCLVGHSYGASVSLAAATIYPNAIEHLILMSPAVPHRSAGQTLAKLQLRVGQKLPRPFKKPWLTSPLLEILSSIAAIKTVSKKRKLELMSIGIKTAREQRPHVLLECLDSFLHTPLYAYAQLVIMPTLLIAGEADIISPLSTQYVLAQYIPQVKVRLMPKVGHLAPIERPGTVGRIIEDFINHKPTPIPSHVHYPDINEIHLGAKQPQKFSKHKYV